jgi:aminobenzoyl-glutamate utilization protein B
VIRLSRDPRAAVRRIFISTRSGRRRPRPRGDDKRSRKASRHAHLGFLTGFSRPRVGRAGHRDHTEYDANPDNSQAPGVAERSSIVPGAPGHCEGHNVNGAVLVASAIALKRTMQRFGLPGTLKVFGAPAEEQLLSRPYFVRDGYFDDVDVAFHEHLGGELNTVYGLTHSALISAKFIFHGETSHAGVAPWKGKDALDAVVLMDVGMAQYRET